VTPVISAPATGTVNENASLTFSSTGNNAITVIDAAAGSSDSLTLTATHGTLTLASTIGITLTGTNGSSSMTIKGPLATMNNALNGLIYAPTSGYYGSAAIALSLTDPGDSLSASASVAITVNSVPVVTAPASEKVSENASFTFSTSGGDPIAVADPIASGTSDTMTLKVGHGKLTLASTAGLTILGGTNGSSSITIQGTLTNLNSALNGLSYTPATGYTGSDTLSISVSDSIDNATGSANVLLTIGGRTITGAVVAGQSTSLSAASTQTAAPADSMTTTSSGPTTEETTQWAGVSAAVEVM
jgi:acyl dehydratase